MTLLGNTILVLSHDIRESEDIWDYIPFGEKNIREITDEIVEKALCLISSTFSNLKYKELALFDYYWGKDVKELPENEKERLREFTQYAIVNCEICLETIGLTSEDRDRAIDILCLYSDGKNKPYKRAFLSNPHIEHKGIDIALRNIIKDYSPNDGKLIVIIADRLLDNLENYDYEIDKLILNNFPVR